MRPKLFIKFKLTNQTRHGFCEASESAKKKRKTQNWICIGKSACGVNHVNSDSDWLRFPTRFRFAARFRYLSIVQRAWRRSPSLLIQLKRNRPKWNWHEWRREKKAPKRIEWKCERESDKSAHGRLQWKKDALLCVDRINSYKILCTFRFDAKPFTIDAIKKPVSAQS